MNTLKELDKNRFVLSLFISEYKYRTSITAIDYLNIELASLRDHIETPHMGLIRLQWWKDEIKKIYGNITAAEALPHPLLEEIRRIARMGKVSYDDFARLIEAREADFDEHETLDIKSYARQIHAPLLHIKAKILGEENDITPLAESYAVLGLILAIPFYRERSQILLPEINALAVKKLVDEALDMLQQDKTHHRYFRAHRVLTRMTARHLARNGNMPENLPPIPFKELKLWWGTLLAS